MLRRLAAQHEPRLRVIARAAKESLLHIKNLQAVRSLPVPAPVPTARQAKPGPPKRTIYDAGSTEALPGKARPQGERPGDGRRRRR